MAQQTDHIGDINKMVTMKLYTEEQVRLLLDLAKLKINGEMYSKDVLLQQVAPIELPSDEEIEKVSDTRLLYTNDNSANFRLGAKWMKDKILNQNKGETLQEWKAKFTHHCSMKPNQNK